MEQMQLQFSLVEIAVNGHANCLFFSLSVAFLN